MLRSSALLVALSFAVPGIPQCLQTPPHVIGPCWVIQVIDGDSIEVRLPDGKTDTVRYVGIDAPEKGNPLFELAQKRNGELVLGVEVWLELELVEEGLLRDRDGRLLSWVFPETLQTASVQAVLVREGLAIVDVRRVVDREVSAGCFPIRHVDSLLEAQVEAAFGRRGLWGLPPFCPDADFLVVGIKHWGDVEEVYLINRGDEPIEVSENWMLMDGSAHGKWEQGKMGRNVISFEALGPNCLLPPGGVLTIRTGPGIPKPDRKTRQGCGTPQVVLNWFGYKIWNADGDTAYLYDPDGALVCSFHYPWQERSP